METSNKTNITVQATVNAPVDKVWELWTGPEHIKKWNAALPDWHTPSATNDLREGGSFSYRMEARDGSMGFDFGGVYNEVKTNELIRYTLGDGRKVSVSFRYNRSNTDISEAFEAEKTNPVEMQKGGWQAILDNFKKYAESGS